MSEKLKRVIITAAADGIGKVIAEAYLETGAKVAICPGAISGARQERVIAARAKAEHKSNDEVRKEVLSVNSLRTLIPPEDIAGCVLYLDSPVGVRVSGQVIAVDGHIPY